jgi:hypothetical protein
MLDPFFNIMLHLLIAIDAEFDFLRSKSLISHNLTSDLYHNRRHFVIFTVSCAAHPNDIEKWGIEFETEIVLGRFQGRQLHGSQSSHFAAVIVYRDYLRLLWQTYLVAVAYIRFMVETSSQSRLPHMAQSRDFNLRTIITSCIRNELSQNCLRTELGV